jgi:transforming growth factor-beta-induced protein
MSNNNTWNFTSNTEDRSIWQLINEAGDLIGQSSQSFVSKSGAEYNAKLLGYKGSYSKQLVWDFFEDNNFWQWTCHNSVNKEEVGKSHIVFDSEIAAMDNASNFGFDSSKYQMRTTIADSIEEIPVVNIEPEKPAVASAFVGGLASSAKIASTVNVSKTPTMNMDFKTNPETVIPNVNMVNNTVENKLEDGGFGSIWKWLLPLLIALIILGLLWWFFSGNKMNNSKINTTNLPPISSKTVSGNILNSLQQPEFTTLNAAIKASGLEKPLNDFGLLTLLAPTNSAFEKLPEGSVTELLKSEKILDLQNLLKLHVLPGNIDLSKVKDGDMLKTLSGDSLKASLVDGKLTIGNVEDIDTKRDSSEGNINLYSLSEVLSTPEKSVSLTSSSALTSSSSIINTIAAMDKTSENSSNNFLNIAKADGRFGTLLTLVKEAGLDSALDQSGPFTVFAPTDAAFASLGQDTLASLQKPENKAKLTEILKYHVVSGKNSFAEFGNNKELLTLNTNKVILGLDEHGQGIVKGSKNTALAPVEDINTDNAIIHVLTDTPLLQ